MFSFKNFCIYILISILTSPGQADSLQQTRTQQCAAHTNVKNKSFNKGKTTPQSILSKNWRTKPAKTASIKKSLQIQENHLINPKGKNALPIWPTDNTAFFQNRPLANFIQATVSGQTESGLFGCVRNNGKRFHEGIDIKSIHRNQYNHTLDRVYAVFPGHVVYVNNNPNKSTYGRYIILQHELPGFSYYTLYAHLSEVHVQPHTNVSQKHILGVMGNSSSSFIPWSRAHLHFEIGLQIGSLENFKVWYKTQNFSTSNEHGMWNGMNLIGLDPLEFLKSRDSFLNFVKHQPIAFTLYIEYAGIPPFIRSHTALLKKPLQKNCLPVAWKVAFNWLACPLQWEPIYKAQKPINLSPKVTFQSSPSASSTKAKNNTLPKCFAQTPDINPSYNFIHLIDYQKNELVRHGQRHTLLIDTNGQVSFGNVLTKTLMLLFGPSLRL